MPKSSAFTTGMRTAAKTAATPPAPPDDSQLIAAVVDDSLKTLLDQVPEDRRDRVKAAAVALRALKGQEDAIEAAKAKAKKTWLEEMALLETQFHVTTMPFLDPLTGKVMFSYRQQQNVLLVEPVDLLETMFEYYKVRQGEEEDLAMIHAEEIIERCQKPKEIDNDKYRALVKTGVIPDEVANAVERYVPRAAFPAFEKPKTGG